jgi:hypothetical protein
MSRKYKFHDDDKLNFVSFANFKDLFFHATNKYHYIPPFQAGISPDIPGLIFSTFDIYPRPNSSLISFDLF